MNLRVVALVLALALDALLVARLARAPAPTPVRLHAIAPPLVHVPGAGEDTVLAPETTAGVPPDGLQRALTWVVQAQGTTTQRAALAELDNRRAALGPSFEEGARLRVAVAGDAAALVTAMGAERTTAFLDAREDLSARWAEARAWSELVARLAGARAGTP
jgi:hypothetical protein